MLALPKSVLWKYIRCCLNIRNIFIKRDDAIISLSLGLVWLHVTIRTIMFTCTMCIWLAYRNLRSISYMYITKGHYHKRNFFKMFFIKLENTQVSKNCCNRCFNWVFNLTDNAVCISTLFSTNIDYYKFQFSI